MQQPATSPESMERGPKPDAKSAEAEEVEPLDRDTLGKYRFETSLSEIERHLAQHPEWKAAMDLIRERIVEKKLLGHPRRTIDQMDLADLTNEIAGTTYTIGPNKSDGEKVVKAIEACLHTAQSPDEVEKILNRG